MTNSKDFYENNVLKSIDFQQNIYEITIFRQSIPII